MRVYVRVPCVSVYVFVSACKRVCVCVALRFFLKVYITTWALLLTFSREILNENKILFDLFMRFGHAPVRAEFLQPFVLVFGTGNLEIFIFIT